VGETFPGHQSIKSAKGSKIAVPQRLATGTEKAAASGLEDWLAPRHRKTVDGAGNASATAELWGIVADQPDATNSEFFPPGISR